MKVFIWLFEKVNFWQFISCFVLVLCSLYLLSCQTFVTFLKRKILKLLFRSHHNHQLDNSTCSWAWYQQPAGAWEQHHDRPQLSRSSCHPQICGGRRPGVARAGLLHWGQLWGWSVEDVICYLQVGTPPPSFCLFFQQYDWNIYSGETLTNKVSVTHPLPHGPNCRSEGPRPIPVDFGCSRFTFERSVGFKKFGWAVFEKNDFLKIWVWV